MRAPRPDLSAAAWRRSTYSNTTGGNCVEVADGLPGVVPVRDSKNPDGHRLIVSAASWQAFVSWRRSTYSNTNGGECVEVADGVPGIVPVRDSKNPGPAVVVSADAWQAFVEHVKD